MPTLKEAAIANMIPVKDSEGNVIGYTADSVSIALDSFAIQMKAQAVAGAPSDRAKELALDAAVKLYLNDKTCGESSFKDLRNEIYEWLIK